MTFTPCLRQMSFMPVGTTSTGLYSSMRGDKFIKNQTLYVKIENAALRADLTMSRATLVHRLNEQVGAQVIADIRFY